MMGQGFSDSDGEGDGEGMDTPNRLARFKTAFVPEEGLRLTGQSMPRRRLQHSLRCAVQGLVETWKTQPNFRLHVLFGISVTAAGLWCSLAPSEWLWITFSIGLVLFAELMNTAVERLVDLIVGIAPHPVARFVKDVSAGAVLVCVMLACVIGWLTFLPHLK